MEISVKLLPFITTSLLVLTIIVTFCLSLSKKHVVGSLPYISDTGTKTPESCIFGQALNILWVLLSFAVYVKYRQVKDILNRYNMDNKKLLNRTAMQIGLGAAFGISIVANFQETNLFYIHWCGTILALGLGAVYQCMQTVLYKNLMRILGQRKITSLRMVLSVISVATFMTLLICAVIAYQQKKNDFNERNVLFRKLLTLA
ncbi:DNA damage-regulated autophagy modulator protein 2-like isoform X2 [Anoplophora glabripennis]|uniref:DNA damage-regulated autophagy modulator protein 2-like isoform X2 n=1 Tax=Anoplophora glabripennis TaxID=217634 RepID=UPI000873BF56|nr:DNA damage-regulated autophagy modulator protein 2-like isoform X2 [Anoplophora glabripennis]